MEECTKPSTEARHSLPGMVSGPAESPKTMSQPVLDPASRLATECLDASGISGGDLHTILSQPCSVTTSSSHFTSEKHGFEQRQRPQAEEQLVPTGREL